MTLATLLAFAFIMAVGILTPGPTVLLALSNGSRFGLRYALYGMLGAVLADLLLVLLVGLGFGALLAASETLFLIVKWLGVAFLAYVGLQMLRAKGGLASVDDAARQPSRWAAVAKSFSVAMGNPKYYFFMSALLPQFVAPAEAQLPQYLALAAVIVAIDVLAMSGYALLGAKSLQLWRENGVKWLNRVSGGALLALAGSIALYRRSA
ncbi:LysE family translocator [Chromobacterium aquaticum]|uniref:LysE family translocator n=1 Tax=Chromobacterium aquaticum TaxID=467180 RepID=A0ABV8ZTM4_9NEIS|nr:LysE family translocator [Chromobacterium aquaticum]MCD5361888.1 LysE family translocator [Chromobacterium aquaticum]